MIELAIAVSVILLGAVILLDRRLPIRVAMAVVAFFGFFHGFMRNDLAIPHATVKAGEERLLGTVC